MIIFTSSPPSPGTYGSTYLPTATANSTLPVTILVAPASAAICSLTGNTISMLAEGTCVLNATQGGDATWIAAALVQQSFSIVKQTQTVAFTSTAPVGAVVATGSYTPAATATSTLPPSITVDNLAALVCRMNPSPNGVLTFIGSGNCILNADQAGNSSFSAAPQTQQSFAVARATQTITITSSAPTDASVDGTAYQATATASSGLAVAWSSDTPGICSTTPAGVVTYSGAGSCTIRAAQGGSTCCFFASADVTQTFSVAKANQTVIYTSTPPTQATPGGSIYFVNAFSTSGFAVSFTIDSSASAVCQIFGSNQVQSNSVGVCIINSVQAGNVNYNAAPTVQQSFFVKTNPTVTITSTAPVNPTILSAQYQAVATTTSGGALTWTGSVANVCSVSSSGLVTWIGQGNCPIRAQDAGSSTFWPNQATQSVPVVRADQVSIFFLLCHLVFSYKVLLA